jgi:hypothetical protein
MVFGDRVPRGIIGTKKEEVIEGWRKMHNEKFNNLYSLEKTVGMVR